MLVLLIISVLVVAYLMYLPKVSIMFSYIGPYVDFPTGYEEIIPADNCHQFKSKLVLNYKTLNRVTIDFGALIRTALLKKYLKPVLDKSKSIRISQVRDMGFGFYFIEVSTKNVRIWLDPHGKTKITNDLREVSNATLEARITSSVYGFELDKEEWKIRGPAFLDTVAPWNMKKIQNLVIEEIKPTTNKKQQFKQGTSKIKNLLSRRKRSQQHNQTANNNPY
jgi:hypothetical protein